MPFFFPDPNPMFFFCTNFWGVFDTEEILTDINSEIESQSKSRMRFLCFRKVLVTRLKTVRQEKDVKKQVTLIKKIGSIADPIMQFSVR